MKVIANINGKVFTNKGPEKVEAEKEEYIKTIEEEINWFTFYEAVDMFIEDAKKEGKVAASTIKNYTHIRDKHLQGLMMIKVVDLTEEMIQEAFDKEIEAGYSPKTVKNFKSLVNKVLAIYRPDLQLNIVIKDKAK
jgi:hypothetical protein